jgi:hypothetical protein
VPKLHVVPTFTVVGFAAGAVVGFALGLSYLPTLPFAVVEGAILIGVPCTLLGLVVAGGWWVVRQVVQTFRTQRGRSVPR